MSNEHSPKKIFLVTVLGEKEADFEADPRVHRLAHIVVTLLIRCETVH